MTSNVEFVASVVADLRTLLQSSGDPHLDAIADPVVSSDGNMVLIEFTLEGLRQHFATQIEPSDVASCRPSLVATTILIEFEEQVLSDDS